MKLLKIAINSVRIFSCIISKEIRKMLIRKIELRVDRIQAFGRSVCYKS